MDKMLLLALLSKLTPSASEVVPEPSAFKSGGRAPNQRSLSREPGLTAGDGSRSPTAELSMQSGVGYCLGTNWKQAELSHGPPTFPSHALWAGSNSAAFGSSSEWNWILGSVKGTCVGTRHRGSDGLERKTFRSC
ncbi:hypothetical protein EYF80_012571 [Liparis tanakae]|uniref:Secreted protein n=1 Tax=Liparis tanakae TaxID=230148 RepID=A0A4Z2IIK6_9TELE|nr:hypothetical protein EYF80_012571 [Liparis tanakae]